jgi:hypothetical protein
MHTEIIYNCHQYVRVKKHVYDIHETNQEKV